MAINNGDIYWDDAQQKWVPIGDSGLGKFKAGWKNFWGNLLGTDNARIQNSAASALQEDAQRFNTSEADKEREFQEYMSNTAIQRQAADYKAAGFNPILATGNGASSGIAAAASSTPSSAATSNISPLQSIATAAASAAVIAKVIKSMMK